MCHTNCPLKRSSENNKRTKKRRAITIRLKNKTSLFNIKKRVRYGCLIKPFCQLYKNTPAYYGTGGTVTVGMNYLVSSCSDDPEEGVSVVSV